MNSKSFILMLLVPVLLFVGFFVFDSSKTSKVDDSAKTTNNTNPSATPTIKIEPADKIEVVHFHATQQCISCSTVGKLALQTITENFSEEYKSGKIVFKDINAELPENKEIVAKYRATRSSLFINAIRGEKENIEEDSTVWLLYSNQTKYLSYFENKLNTLLGK